MGLGRRGDAAPTRVCSNGERLDLQPNAAESNRATTAQPTTGALPASSIVPTGKQPPR